MDIDEPVTATTDTVLETLVSLPDSSGYASEPPRTISWSRFRQIGYSIADQGLAVGGMFLANVVLARVQSKQEYGMFALSYSVYTFISSIHNALILEPYSIYGGGRYYDRFSSYSRHMSRNNALLGAGLTTLLSTVWLLLKKFDPTLVSNSLLGLALAAPILLSALFIRRTLYLRRRPDLAARFSVVCFLSLTTLLAITVKVGLLNGFSTFLIAAIAWIVAGLTLLKELPSLRRGSDFTRLTPGHWSEHWNYSRWVLATAFVFQLTSQAYYWILAGFCSLQQVAELRAMYIFLAPVEQIFTALTLLILPTMSFYYISKQGRQLVTLWKRFGTLMVSINCLYAGFIWGFGGLLMHHAYKGKFDDVSAILAVFAIFPVIMSLGNSLNVALKSLERPDFVFRSYVVSGVGTATIGLLLVRHLGLRGAVLGMLCSAALYTFSMTLGLSHAKRKLTA